MLLQAEFVLTNSCLPVSAQLCESDSIILTITILQKIRLSNREVK